MKHTVYVATPMGERMPLVVEFAAAGVYHLVGADEKASMDGWTLVFSLYELDPEVKNLDDESESFTCFGQSEYLTAPEMDYKYGIFYARSVDELQKGLDRLCGALISHEKS